MKFAPLFTLILAATLFTAGCEKHDPAQCAADQDAKTTAGETKPAPEATPAVDTKDTDKAAAEAKAKAAADAKAKEIADAKAATDKLAAEKAAAEKAAADKIAADKIAADKIAAAKAAADKAAAAKPTAPAGLIELVVKLPKQRLDGTPQPPKGEPNMEVSKPKGYTRPKFYVPKGVTNLAKGKTVTVSEEPMIGDLDQIVDGNAESTDDTTLDLDSGPAWVVVDLGKKCEIFAILMWHRHNNIYAFRDVIVEVADDKDFIENRKVIFNNDHDGSLGKGHGKGTDKQYLETYEGKLLDAKGVKGRYVRFWSNGNTVDKSTYWIEAMVFGR